MSRKTLSARARRFATEIRNKSNTNSKKITIRATNRLSKLKTDYDTSLQKLKTLHLPLNNRIKRKDKLREEYKQAQKDSRKQSEKNRTNVRTRRKYASSMMSLSLGPAKLSNAASNGARMAKKTSNKAQRVRKAIKGNSNSNSSGNGFVHVPRNSSRR